MFYARVYGIDRDYVLVLIVSFSFGYEETQVMHPRVVRAFFLARTTSIPRTCLGPYGDSPSSEVHGPRSAVWGIEPWLLECFGECCTAAPRLAYLYSHVSWGLCFTLFL